MNKKNYYITPLFFFLAAIAIGVYLVPRLSQSEIGFPLDDAWIHQVFARNIAEGNGWTFNTGQPSAGLTAPLWGAMLALGQLIFHSPYPMPLFLGWVLLSLLGITVSKVTSSVFPNKPFYSILAGAIFIFEWHFVWAALSGMETLLFALIVLAILSQLLKPSADGIDIPWIKLGIAIGIAVWVRPEAILLLPPILLTAFLNLKDKKQLVRIFNKLIKGFGIPFLLYLAFNYWLSRNFWPTTFYAKQAEYSELLSSPILSRVSSQISLVFVGVGIILLPAFIYILAKSIKEKNWGILSTGIWYLGTSVMYALRLPVTYQHGRYMIPAMAIYLLLSCIGLISIFEAVKSNPHKLSWMAKPIWGFSTILVTIAFFILGNSNYQADVKFINTEMVEMGKWIESNTPKNVKIATHDIGAIGYFGQREIIDLAGLISPEVIPFIRDEFLLLAHLECKQPDYFVTFPSWYPELTPQSGELFITNGSRSTDYGLDSMKIFAWWIK